MAREIPGPGIKVINSNAPHDHQREPRSKTLMGLDEAGKFLNTLARPLLEKRDMIFARASKQLGQFLGDTNDFMVSDLLFNAKGQALALKTADGMQINVPLGDLFRNQGLANSFQLLANVARVSSLNDQISQFRNLRADFTRISRSATDLSKQIVEVRQGPSGRLEFDFTAPQTIAKSYLRFSNLIYSLSCWMCIFYY